MATTQTIRGLDELIDCLDAAVQRGTPEEITGCVKDTLVDIVSSGSLELPPPLVRPRSDGYARRLVHRSPEHGYTVLAMTWGPGQGTPLHDHAGMWCVEGVLRGEIDVARHDLAEERDGLYRFRPEGTVRAGTGNAGTLIPPFEYHTITNASATGTAVTLHVYAGEMTRCTIFVPRGDGWHERQERQLGYHQ